MLCLDTHLSRLRKTPWWCPCVLSIVLTVNPHVSPHLWAFLVIGLQRCAGQETPISLVTILVPGLESSELTWGPGTMEQEELCSSQRWPCWVPSCPSRGKQQMG